MNDPGLSELELEALLDEVLTRIRDALGVDTAAILLFDDEREMLVARAAKGLEQEVEQGVRIPVEQGFAGRIAAERLPIFIADVDHADVLNPILRERGVRSLLGVPLIVEGEVIGVPPRGHTGTARVRERGRGCAAARGRPHRAGHRTRTPLRGARARAPGRDRVAAEPASRTDAGPGRGCGRGSVPPRA